MRKIEEKMCRAIANGQNWTLDNTRVEQHGGTTCVVLFGNLIARINRNGIRLFDGGHRTTTTKSRLNAVLSNFNSGHVYQRNHVWYYADDMGTIPFESGMAV